MKKTQQISNKASFKALLNVQQQKLPQKKSRSRSIRDRNNTSNTQITISRATQYKTVNNQKQTPTRLRQNTWANNIRTKNQQTLSIQKSQDQKFSNISRQQSSIQKIRQNMRKQSQEFIEKQRNRSHSRRRNNSRNRSKQNSFSRFPGSMQGNGSNKSIVHNEQQKIACGGTKQPMNQIIKLKNRLKTTQNIFQSLSQQLSYIKSSTSNKHLSHNNNNNFSLKKSISQSNIYNNEQYFEQLKQKSYDLDNILSTFDITFKENMTRMNKELNQRVDEFKKQIGNKSRADQISGENSGSAINSQKKFYEKENDAMLFQTLINNLQAQYNINGINGGDRNNVGKGFNNNNNRSIFDIIRENQKNSFSDLQKKLILAEERLLK